MQDSECAVHLIERLFHCSEVTFSLFTALLYCQRAKGDFTKFISYRNLITYINLGDQAARVKPKSYQAGS